MDSDALECPHNFGIPSDLKRVLDFVKELVALRLPNLHICVTSRLEIDIGDSLEPLASHTVSLHLSVVYSDAGKLMKRRKNEDKELVIRTLSEGSDGFKFLSARNVAKLPPTEYPACPSRFHWTRYERVLKEIGEANQHQAHRLLQCLTVAIRPLRVWSLAEIPALDFDGAGGGIQELNKD
ncbi:hypothetical protein EDB89DRAFT_2072548 [Lactarius sanguifluus]|nr:hypothetical protein EDB89DRAFT_2072548 [Lactarius sanguifluus]